MKAIFMGLSFWSSLALASPVSLPRRGQADCPPVDVRNQQMLAVTSAWNFDWDDNIFYMPTKIVAYHKVTHEAREISTAAFAEIRLVIGQSGPWKDYELNVDPRSPKNSFLAFRDGKGGRNPFLEDMKKAIQADPRAWQGPSFSAFRVALNDPETAKRTTLITARGHSPRAILEGLNHLKELGCIRYLPPEENIHAVAGTENPSLEKVKRMQQILEALNKEPIERGPTVVQQSGVGRRSLHIWGFSDDDYGNYEKALAFMKTNAKDYPNVKVQIFYTGFCKEGQSPHSVIVDLNGRERAPLPSEENEFPVLRRPVETGFLPNCHEVP